LTFLGVGRGKKRRGLVLKGRRAPKAFCVGEYTWEAQPVGILAEERFHKPTPLWV